MNRDKLNSIEDLFRKVLDESEVTPGDKLTGKIMGKVMRKEFLQFNPSRFNVWYLGGIAVTCAFVGIMVFSTPVAMNKVKPSSSVMVYDSSKQHIDSDTLLLLSDLSESTLPDKKASEKITGENSSKHSGSAPHEKASTITHTSKEKQSLPISIPVLTGSDKKDELPVLAAGMESSVSSGCVPLYVKFTNTSSGNVSQEWDFGDGGTSDDENPEWVYDVQGVYKVTLYAKDAAGRKAITSLEINVWPKPKAAFDILPVDPVIPADEITFANQSSGAISYKWYFGDGTSSQLLAPVHKYHRQGKYTVALVAVSENGCTDSLSIQDTFTETDCYIRFPNAFVPNKGGPIGGYYSQLTDNTNIIFHPVYSGVIDYNLKIYSKQGHMVFQSDDIYLGWDGYYHGQLCASGVYVWRAEGKFRNGESYVISGDLTLVNY